MCSRRQARLPHLLFLLSFLPCELLDTQYQYSTTITQNKRISNPQGTDGPPLVFCVIFIISHKDLKTSGETAFCPQAVTTPIPQPPYFSCTHSVRVHMGVCVCACRAVCSFFGVTLPPPSSSLVGYCLVLASPLKDKGI